MVEEVSIIEPITIIYRKKKIEDPPRRIHPIHICLPGSFLYQDTKGVPWRYDTTAYVGGKTIQFSDVKIVNVAGTGGTTRSGWLFSPKYIPRVSPSPTVVPPKDKVVPTPSPQAGASMSTTPVMTIVLSMTKATSNKAAEAETSKGKEIVNENEQN